MGLAIAGFASLIRIDGWAFFAWTALVPLVILIWIVSFFRDPERVTPGEAGLIISPADGVVSHIDEVEESDFIGGKAIRLSIFLSIFNVHLNRAPVAGRVIYSKYKKGEFVNAMRADSGHLNEYNDIGLEVDDSRMPRILIRQIAGLIARRIVCEAKKGDSLSRGERYGMIKFSSRTSIYLPIDTPISWQVKVGDPVRAGATVLGKLS